jgi:DNA-binding CsgD family transcriptional regulator
MNEKKYSSIIEDHFMVSCNNVVKLIKTDKSANNQRSYINQNSAPEINLKSLFELPCNVFFINTESVVVDANTATANSVLCTSPKEMFGHTMRAWTIKEHAEIIFEHDGNVMQNGINILEESWKDHCGSILSGISMKVPWLDKDDKVCGIFGITVFLQNNNLSLASNLFSKTGLLGTSRTHESLKQVLSSSELEGIYLPRRETECLYFLVRGKSAKEIAKALKIAPKTAEFYIRNMREKLGGISTSDLIEKAIDSGFANVVPRSLVSKID